MIVDAAEPGLDRADATRAGAQPARVPPRRRHELLPSPARQRSTPRTRSWPPRTGCLPRARTGQPPSSGPHDRARRRPRRNRAARLSTEQAVALRQHRHLGSAGRPARRPGRRGQDHRDACPAHAPGRRSTARGAWSASRRPPPPRRSWPTTSASCENTAKWLHEHGRGNASVPSPDQLVIIDEATLAGTRTLDRITGLAAERRREGAAGRRLGPAPVGRRRRCVRDARRGPHRTPELTEIHRFTNAWETTASLDLRHGRVEAIGAYAATTGSAMAPPKR